MFSFDKISISKALSYLFVASLWGITNPLLKRASSIHLTHQNDSMITMLKSLIYDYRKLFPFIFNQMGSLMFYYLLANEPVTIASPLCNSLTFTITSITAYYLGERSQSPLLLFSGIILVLLGTYISFLS